MPDITMCNGNNCLLRLNCYRHTAKAEELGQSYFKNAPFKMSLLFDEDTANVGVATLVCTHFWNNKEYKNEQESTNK